MSNGAATFRPRYERTDPHTLESAMQKISPFLWFDNQAEEAAKFYTSVFPNSKILESNPMIVNFELEGEEFTALNGGPQHFGFTEAISFVISCDDQQEVDYYWDRLTAEGGEPGPCGWLKDRYGLSWQVVPTVLPQLLGHPDQAKAARVQEALMKMGKLDIAQLQAAAA
jgi:predicted 3-demethylubiquinone-9 3-methyltransferase (glyoxalase superfamily)